MAQILTSPGIAWLTEEPPYSFELEFGVSFTGGFITGIFLSAGIGAMTTYAGAIFQSRDFWTEHFKKSIHYIFNNRSDIDRILLASSVGTGILSGVVFQRHVLKPMIAKIMR